MYFSKFLLKVRRPYTTEFLLKLMNHPHMTSNVLFTSELLPFFIGETQRVHLKPGPDFDDILVTKKHPSLNFAL